jgi:hypothetical protein
MELDADSAVQEEVRNAARSLAQAVAAVRAGRMACGDEGLEEPRQK